jgi:hypothetical protein
MNLKPFFPINPLGALAMDHAPLNLEHVVQGWIPTARVVLGESSAPLLQRSIVPTLGVRPSSRTAEARQATSPALTDAATSEVFHRPAPLHGRHRLPSTRSMSAARARPPPGVACPASP